MVGVGTPCHEPVFSKFEFTEVIVFPTAAKPEMVAVPGVGALSEIPRFEASPATATCGIEAAPELSSRRLLLDPVPEPEPFNPAHHSEPLFTAQVSKPPLATSVTPAVKVDVAYGPLSVALAVPNPVPVFTGPAQ